MKKFKMLGIGAIGMVLFCNSCNKDMISPSSIYIPTSSDVTASATLTELQQGRSIYLNKCGSCHGLYSPDSFSSSSWKSIVPGMASRVGLSQADAALVVKYVSKGK